MNETSSTQKTISKIYNLYQQNLYGYIAKHIHQVWIHRNQVRHGVTFSEQIEKWRQVCVAEVSLYYEYKTNNLLTNDLPEHIFYSTIQEHLHKESKLSEIDQWLCNY